MSNEVKIRVSADDTSKPVLQGAERNVKKLDKSANELSDGGLKKAGGGFSAFAETAAKGGAVLGTLVGVAAVANKVLGEGIAVSLGTANAQVSLGAKGFASLSAAAKDNALNLGLTEAEFIKTGGQAASLAKNLGFSQEKAAEFGAAMPDLANKLSIMSNGQVDAAGAADQLRSAIAGEFDPLQAIGIAINAASVQQEALKLKQQSTTKITNVQATAMAVLSIVQRQTADASKVLATEEGRQAQAAARSKAEMREAFQDLERSAVPALTKLTEATADYVEAWSHIGDNNRGNIETIKDIANVMAPLTSLVDVVVKKTTDQGHASKSAAVDVAKLGDGAQGAAASEEDLAKATDEAVDAIKDQIDVTLGGRSAARQYQKALDAATDSLHDNGKTLDITTEKGRANSEALDDIAQAAIDQAEAVKRAGGSEEDYRGQLERSRADLVKTAMRFGMSKSAAQDYAATILGIPRKYDTHVKLDAAGAIQKARDVRYAINLIHEKTVYMTIRETTYRSAQDIAHSRGEHRAGGVVGGAAAGGGARSGMVLVGEEGPELAQLGAGAFVHTAGETRRMLGGMSGGGGHMSPIVLNVNIGGMQVGRVLVDPLRAEVKRLGGNVQVALGTGRGQSAAAV